MRRVTLTRRTATAAVLTAAVVGAASAATLAATASSTSVFRGCLSRGQRTLYNVRFNPAVAVRCRRGDRRVSWNQTGRMGARGRAGATGVAGAPGQQGQPGQAGANGKTVLSGAGVPSAGTGADGDFYVDTSAHALYGPKSAGNWGSSVSLIGPKGNQGAPGLTGFTTETGTTSTIPAGNVGAIDVPCPAGETAISGGYTIPFGATVLEDHARTGSPGTWTVVAAFPSVAGTITAYAQCATVQ